MQCIFHITYHCHFESLQAHRGVVWPHRDVRAQSARPQQRSQGGVCCHTNYQHHYLSRWPSTKNDQQCYHQMDEHHQCQRSHPHPDHSRCGPPSPGWRTKRTLEASETSSRALARWTSWTTWQCILQKTAFSLVKSRLALGSPSCLVAINLPIAQKNDCWLPPSYHIYRWNPFTDQTRPDKNNNWSSQSFA